MTTIGHQRGYARSSDNLAAQAAFRKSWLHRQPREPWDPPPFSWLVGAASLLALFTTILILATQRHDDELARHREVLTLEIASLSEQKATRIIQMLSRTPTGPADGRTARGATPWRQPSGSVTFI